MRTVPVGGRHALLCTAAALAVLATCAASALGASATPRIVGGQTTTIAEYPWQVALVISPAESGGNAFQRQFCGGALVTPRIVLTAAHCVYETDPDFPDPPPGDGTPRIDPDDVDVALGRTTLSSGAGEEKSVVAVDFQSADDPHPSPPAPAYNPVTSQNDVGYLVLASKPAPATAASTIDIAAASEAAVWAPGVFNEISGWGTTAESGSGSDTLRAASVPIVSDVECSSDYGGDFDADNMVCAGYEEGGIDTCQGDSGGPLEAPVEGGGYRLTGLTSWGAGCARPNAPGVYSRVSGPTLREAIVARVDGFESSIPIPAGEQEEVVSAGGGVPASGPPKYPPPTTQTQVNPPVQTTPPPAVQPRSDPFTTCKKIRSKRKRKKCIRRVQATL